MPNKNVTHILNFFKSYLFFLLITFNTSVEGSTVRRAAFDFGSSKIKLQVADVDTETHIIVKSIYSEAVAVLLSGDAANDPQGFFSKKIRKKALRVTHKLMQKAKDLGAVEYTGVATEAYRKAPNGQSLVDDYLAELNIPVKIISQIEEGQIGFLALIAETNLSPSKVISWDIGGGSFQITYFDEVGNIQVYMAPYGRITTKNAIIKFVKGGDPAKIESPNPMSMAEWENSLEYFKDVLPAVPESLSRKLREVDVQLIGMAAHPERLRSLKTYERNHVIEVLEERLNKCDQELAQVHSSPASALSELVLVYSIMNKLEVFSVDYIRTSSGSTSALLISDEYWPVTK